MLNLDNLQADESSGDEEYRRRKAGKGKKPVRRNYSDDEDDEPNNLDINLSGDALNQLGAALGGLDAQHAAGMDVPFRPRKEGGNYPIDEEPGGGEQSVIRDVEFIKRNYVKYYSCLDIELQDEGKQICVFAVASKKLPDRKVLDFISYGYIHCVFLARN